LFLILKLNLAIEMSISSHKTIMMKKLALTLILISIGINFFAQVAINTDNSLPDNSAILDIKSGNKGVLIPRMTIEERNAIENPADGLMIYCTNCGIKGSLSIFAGGYWNTYSPCPDVSAPVEGYPEVTPDNVAWTWDLWRVIQKITWIAEQIIPATYGPTAHAAIQPRLSCKVIQVPAIPGHPAPGCLP
jgi:hypothetical protein